MWKSKGEFVSFLKKTWVFKEGFASQLSYAWNKIANPITRETIGEVSGMTLEQAQANLRVELNGLADKMADWYWQYGEDGLDKMIKFLTDLEKCSNQQRAGILSGLGFSAKAIENLSSIRSAYPEVDILAPLKLLPTDGEVTISKQMLQSREAEAATQAQQAEQQRQQVAAKAEQKRKADQAGRQAAKKGVVQSVAVDDDAEAEDVVKTPLAPVVTPPPTTTAPSTPTTTTPVGAKSAREYAEELAAEGAKNPAPKKSGLGGLIEGDIGAKLTNWAFGSNGMPITTLFTMLFRAIGAIVEMFMGKKAGNSVRQLGSQYSDEILQEVAVANLENARSNGLDAENKRYSMKEEPFKQMVEFRDGLVKDTAEFLKSKLKADMTDEQRQAVFAEMRDFIKEKIKTNFPKFKAEDYTEIPLERDGKTAYFFEDTRGGTQVAYFSPAELATYGSEFSGKVQKVSDFDGVYEGKVYINNSEVNSSKGNRIS